MSAKSQANLRPFEHRLIVRETSFTSDGEASIQTIYAALARDEARNELILADVISALKEGRSPIVLTERKEHLAFFEARLRPIARHLVVLQGGMAAKASRVAREQLASIPASHERLLLATGRYIGEGFDDPQLDTLFLTMPVSWKGMLVQYTEDRGFLFVGFRIPPYGRRGETNFFAALWGAIREGRQSGHVRASCAKYAPGREVHCFLARRFSRGLTKLSKSARFGALRRRHAS